MVYHSRGRTLSHSNGKFVFDHGPKVGRRIQKKVKKKSWGTKNNTIAPIIVPSTPDSELLRRLRDVMDKSNSKHKFTIVEKGGRTLESVLVNNRNGQQ